MPDTVALGYVPPGAVTAELTIRYGEVGVDPTSDLPPPQWTFEVGARPDLPGSELMPWRDAAGTSSP